VACTVGSGNADVHRQPFRLSDGGFDGALRGGQPHRRGHDEVGVAGGAICRLLRGSVPGPQSTR
jgi:hypothetical protein